MRPQWRSQWRTEQRCLQRSTLQRTAGVKNDRCGDCGRLPRRSTLQRTAGVKNDRCGDCGRSTLSPRFGRSFFYDQALSPHFGGSILRAQQQWRQIRHGSPPSPRFGGSLLRAQQQLRKCAKNYISLHVSEGACLRPGPASLRPNSQLLDTPRPSSFSRQIFP